LDSMTVEVVEEVSVEDVVEEVSGAVEGGC
jgi:hypothetical protein